MKSIRQISVGLMLVAVISIVAGGCKMSKTKKGAAIGTGSGAVIGAVVGRASGNTALGALIGATVGGVTGAIIGRKMDKQAEDIEKAVPDAKVYRVGEGIIVEFNDKILFGFDQSDLNPSSKTNLNQLVTILKKYPDTNIEVQGHTDNTGTEKYNLNLSKKRASNVTSYLKQQGIASSRTSIKGYGELAPNYSNDTEDGRAKNRRVEFLITANEKMQAEAQSESAK